MASRHRSHEEVSINLTPMIDVVFLLVIFFMVGSKFSESESRINVSVPAASQLQSISRTPDERVVMVTAEGTITLDGQLVNREQLAESLRVQYANYPGLKVAVSGHEDCNLLQFGEVLNTVRSVGIDKIGIAVRLNRNGGTLR